MQTDYLIIGAGIAGTLISYELLQRNKSVVVIDDTDLPKSSTAAGAILNPVNIKQWTVAKNYKLYIQQALETYSALQVLLNIPVISERPIIAFDQNTEGNTTSLNEYLNKNSVEEISVIQKSFRQIVPANKIFPAYQVNGISLLTAWRKYLADKNLFFNERFLPEDLSVSGNTISYKFFKAEKIIFCEGVFASQNSFFPNLSFTKNRGDALLLSIPGLPEDFIYHNEIRLIPMGNQRFWCGSNYTWNYHNLEPDIEWRQNIIALLQQWLRLPFIIEEHIVAERPTTAGQQPITQIHDALPAAIFNGLGTKGFLMAPLLAKKMAMMLITE